MALAGLAFDFMTPRQHGRILSCIHLMQGDRVDTSRLVLIAAPGHDHASVQVYDQVREPGPHRRWQPGVGSDHGFLRALRRVGSPRPALRTGHATLTASGPQSAHAVIAKGVGIRTPRYR